MTFVPSAARHSVGRSILAWLGLTALVLSSSSTFAQNGPAEGKEGLVELSRFDPRLKGHYAPKGFKVQIIAAEPTIIDPTGMAFDDQGNLYVSEWKFADHMFDTMDTLKLPEGGTTRIVRRRKGTTDVVKRLRDTNGDGVYDEAEVVVDGVEMPASIFPWKNSLYLTSVGKLERWSDEDGDGRFEQRTILADGFCGFYHHWLSGMVLNADGWFYLTAGDNDNHVVGSDGSRVEISRCGGVFRGRVDGSKMNFFSMGFRNPYRDLAFNSTFDPFLVDNDQEEGSKFQGVRLINPVEGGDYGWRLTPGAFCCNTDFDRAAVNGELPGKLPIISKTGRGASAGLLAYNGTAFPDSYRDLVIYPDVFRKSVRAYRVAPKGGSYELKEELTLMTADDDLFRPCNAIVGADGAIYVVDWRSNSGGAGRLWGDGKWGRIYKLTWEGDGTTPALPTKENNWKRVMAASHPQLLEMIKGRDYNEANRAQRELVSRGEEQRGPLLALMNDVGAPLHARLLGLQGARQLWNDTVENAMIKGLDDHIPEIRRLSAQSLAWEPEALEPKLIPILVEHLKDSNGRALRDIALALSRHGYQDTLNVSHELFRWLLNNPKADVVTRDAFIRALERHRQGVDLVADPIGPLTDMAYPPPAEVDLKAAHKEAVAVFIAFRSAQAAKRLPNLAIAEGLTDDERAALIRQFKDIPLTIPVPTVRLAEWVTEHSGEVGPSVKVATLDVCRLAGNSAVALVVKLLDDKDEVVRLSATLLAAQSRPAGSIEKLSERLNDPKRSLAERTAIANALQGAGTGVFAALEKAYQQFPKDQSFRKIALRAMADADRGKTNPIATQALMENAPEVRSEALQILGETPQSALILGQAFLDGKLQRGDLPSVMTAVRKYGDSVEHRKLVAQIDEAVAKGNAKLDLEAVKARVAKGADPWAGLSVYMREGGALKCYSCHKIENFGGTVGPALTGVEQALSVDKMIEAILEPSKEIKEGYESQKVALKDGRVLTGIKVTQDASTLVLKDANGQETKVPISEIDEQAKDPNSMMPVGLVYDLTPDELGDLLAFLRDKNAQSVFRNSKSLHHWLAIGPFAPDPDESFMRLDKIEPDKTFSGQNGSPVSWVPLDASSRGNITLRGQFGLNPGRAYLATHIKSAVAQDAALRFALDGPARVYLNGGKVADAPASPRVDYGVGPITHLSLKPGWNTLVIAVDRPTQGEGQAMVDLGTSQPVEVSPRKP